jgi:hypothetical protein
LSNYPPSGEAVPMMLALFCCAQHNSALMRLR